MTRPLRLATLALLVAAAGSLVQAVLIIVEWGTVYSTNVLRSMTRNSVTGIYLGQLGATIGTGYGVVTGGLGTVLWSWLALAAHAGRRWVRVAAIVLGALAALGFGVGLIPYWPMAVRIAAAVVALAAVAAVVLMYRPSVSQQLRSS